MLRSALKAFDFSLLFSDSPARLIEVADFLFRFLGQVRKLAENTADCLRWRRRGEQMPLAWSRMRGANLIRAEVNDSRLTQRRAEGVKLALPKVATA